MADADESLEEACDVTVGLAECYAEGCWGECTLQMVKPFATLCILCMAAESGAYVLKPLNLPTITLFIFFGVLIGPFGMSMLSTVDVGRLSWINEVALGFIGLSAGGKFHLQEILKNLKPVLIILFWLTFVTWSFVVLGTLCFATYFMPFMNELTSTQKICVAIVTGCLGAARSPSSAIAIIEELQAKGQFTTTCLAVTVLLDVVVVLLFAVTNLVSPRGLPTTEDSAVKSHVESPARNGSVATPPMQTTDSKQGLPTGWIEVPCGEGNEASPTKQLFYNMMTGETSWVCCPLLVREAAASELQQRAALAVHFSCCARLAHARLSLALAFARKLLRA
ncbi:hypothetical protein EMIHUDRAFT_237217 [Emiliania huxleyi CCMP1516]|uniref:WW domain-containing protein n=2 Tax=Emiliania huxleyi TaxID=2903 RepID=A0A0D3JRC7_EMIH1|nr:hypothetical protein EMIHUDRAFT_237217 [Emiliania huxleyi CCMP1516]EOD26062.1 hypothetical protein EMIHUDRAFT_237217 [Emiliania huxleyi CCMP1516]|eukprot:XP_005778491.1 hypothetical protein EMIHUDRAFT_237217 [Emiliania huxleyi CCMP1516]